MSAQNQNFLALGITIDCLYLAFTTKSIWTQGHTFLHKEHERLQGSHNLCQWETDESPGNARVHLGFIPNLLIRDYDKRAFCQQFPENQSMINSCGNRSQAQRTNLKIFPNAG